MEINEKIDELFIENYILSRYNATEAYKRTFQDCTDMQPHSIHCAASNMKLRLQDKILERMKEINGPVDELLEAAMAELKNIAVMKPNVADKDRLKALDMVLKIAGSYEHKQEEKSETIFVSFVDAEKEV